jgi:ABC-type nitrate/sulfonate/bicarbonate transport system ATPase subunit
MDKVQQLHQTVSLRHGVMLVGPTGSGKSAALNVLAEALTRETGNVKIIIDLLFF